MSRAYELNPFSPNAEYAVGSPAPPANDGNTGSLWHWQTIQRALAAMRRAGYRNIRVDQQQVREGRIVGVNRPDIQAVDPRGQRVIVEVDTDPGESRRHQQVITRLDPSARSIFILRDPGTGRVSRRVVDRRPPVARRSAGTRRQREAEYLMQISP